MVDRMLRHHSFLILFVKPHCAFCLSFSFISAFNYCFPLSIVCLWPFIQTFPTDWHGPTLQHNFSRLMWMECFENLLNITTSPFCDLVGKSLELNSISWINKMKQQWYGSFRDNILQPISQSPAKPYHANPISCSYQNFKGYVLAFLSGYVFIRIQTKSLIIS